MATTATVTEADILQMVISPANGDLPRKAAQSLLTLRFDRATTQVIRQLLRRNNRGTISAEERLDLEKYLRVGQLLDLLHAKARLSIQRTPDVP